MAENEKDTRYLEARYDAGNEVVVSGGNDTDSRRIADRVLDVAISARVIARGIYEVLEQILVPHELGPVTWTTQPPMVMDPDGRARALHLDPVRDPGLILHPQYGECDALGEYGACTECRRNRAYYCGVVSRSIATRSRLGDPPVPHETLHHVNDAQHLAERLLAQFPQPGGAPDKAGLAGSPDEDAPEWYTAAMDRLSRMGEAWRAARREKPEAKDAAERPGSRDQSDDGTRPESDSVGSAEGEPITIDEFVKGARDRSRVIRAETLACQGFDAAMERVRQLHPEIFPTESAEESESEPGPNSGAESARLWRVRAVLDENNTPDECREADGRIVKSFFAPHNDECRCVAVPDLRPDDVLESRELMDRVIERTSRPDAPAEPVLCYVDDQWAYFTTQRLEDQWGDDWNDAPYEHNAGRPYEPCWHRKGGKSCDCTACEKGWNPDGTPKWVISKVAWNGQLDTPSGGIDRLNSPWSVQDINGGVIPWLRTNKYAGSNVPRVIIPAGITLSTFRTLVEAVGGQVYTSESTITLTGYDDPTDIADTYHPEAGACNADGAFGSCTKCNRVQWERDVSEALGLAYPRGIAKPDYINPSAGSAKSSDDTEETS